MSKSPDPMICPRCETPLGYVCTKDLHERRWGLYWNIGELFFNKEKFDVYACKRCGRVEMFIVGIGDEFRPH